MVAARAEELEIGRGVVIRGRHDVINVKSKAKQVAPVALATEVPLQTKTDDGHLLAVEAEVVALLGVVAHDSDDGVHVEGRLRAEMALVASLKTSSPKLLGDHESDLDASPAPRIDTSVLLRRRKVRQQTTNLKTESSEPSSSSGAPSSQR
jgi:hypothetical protein